MRISTVPGLPNACARAIDGAVAAKDNPAKAKARRDIFDLEFLDMIIGFHSKTRITV